ncbi:MAG: tyrosine recombinase XerC [Oscillospiraceae bacterium]|nr:tyrosine recombinase XerC [Oscillospiraceae bacterium]
MAQIIKTDFSDCPQIAQDFLFYMMTIKGRSVRTVEAYHVDLRLYFRYLKCIKVLRSFSDDIESLRCDDLDPNIILSASLSDAYAYLHYLQQQRDNSAATRSRKVSALKSFYKYLNTKTTLLKENPLKDLEVPSLKKSMPKYLTLEQSIQLLSVVDGPHRARDYCIITLLLNCGMRLSELVGINLQDIREDTIKLLGKGNKERIIYINQACKTAIEDYLRVRETPIKEADKHALLLSGRNTRLTGRRVEQIVEENLKKAGLSGMGFSPHKLRHTAATLMYQHGNVDIRVLKELLGHANLGTTEIYTHVSNEQLEKAATASPLSDMKPVRKKKIDSED